MSPISQAKCAYTSEKNAFNCLLDQIAALLRDQNVDVKKLEEAMRRFKVSWDVFSATYEGLIMIQCEDETQEEEAREREFEEWEQEFGKLDVRHWDLLDDLAEAVADKVQEKQTESEPYQYEVAAADENQDEDLSQELSEYSKLVSQNSSCLNSARTLIERANRNAKQFYGVAHLGFEDDLEVTEDEAPNERVTTTSLPEGEYNKKAAEEKADKDAAVKKAAEEKAAKEDLSQSSEKLSESEYYKKVKELESVEAADENREEDLTQSSKEPSEGEFYKEAIPQTKMEAAGSKDPDGKPPKVNSLVGEEEVINKLVGGEIFDPGPLEETGGVTGHSTGNLLSPSKPRFRMVGEENENLVGTGRPPEVSSLVDKEDVNLAGDGKPSEVNKKLVQGSEAEEVPGIPEVTQDEAHDTEHVSITGLSGDEAIKVEKDPEDEVSKKLIKESEAEEVSEVPAAVPEGAPSEGHDSKGHSGDDAAEDEKVPGPVQEEALSAEHDNKGHSEDDADGEKKVPDAAPDEARSAELVTTTSRPEDDADPEEHRVPKVPPDKAPSNEHGTTTSLPEDGTDPGEEVKVPQVAQDEALNKERATTTILPGDDDNPEATQADSEHGSKGHSEDDADGEKEVPDGAPEEALSTEQDSTSLSGDEADPEEKRVPEAPPDEARNNERVTTTSLPEGDADPEAAEDEAPNNELVTTPSLPEGDTDPGEEKVLDAAVQDEAPNKESVNIIGHSGDDAEEAEEEVKVPEVVKEEASSIGHVTTSSRPEDDAEEEQAPDEPEAPPDEALNKERVTTASLPGDDDDPGVAQEDDADGEEKVPDAPQDEALSNEYVATTSLPEDDAKEEAKVPGVQDEAPNMERVTATSLPEDDVVPEATPDEAHDKEHNSKGHSEDDAEGEGNEPEVPAVPPDDVPAVVQGKAPSEEHDSKSHSGVDAVNEEKVPEPVRDEALNKERATTSLPEDDADPEEVEAPEVPAAPPDKAHNREQDSISLSGDDVAEEEKAPDDPEVNQGEAPHTEHVSTKSLPEDEAGDEVKDPGEDADEVDKHPEVNANKEGEAAAIPDEEVGCADETINVEKPMDYEVKNNVRRYVPDLVNHQNREDCPTERCEDSQPLHENERPAQPDAVTQKNRFRPENITRLRERLNSVMLKTNKYEKARKVVARILTAHKKSIPVGGENMKKALQVELTVNLLNKARDLMLVVSAWEVTPIVPKLESLDPVYERGVWTCEGRLGKMIKSLLGKENLPILHNKEQQLSKQAAEQSVAYINHYLELSLDKQPRAQTTTPSRSLPPTKRPAGAGGQCRAGPPNRLDNLVTMLCLTTNPFLCTNPEMDEIYKEVLPENVVVPLFNSGPLSVPSALSLNEVTSGVLSQYKTKYKKVSLSDESYNEVLPENVVVPLFNPGPLSKPSALSQYEVTSRVLSPQESMPKKVSQSEPKLKKFSQNENKYKRISLNENKYKKLSQQETKFKKVSQNEVKKKDLPQSETKSKGLSQCKMASPSLSLSTYLLLSTEGAGGALTGHSTAAHRSLRSLPPALEPGIKETTKTGLPSGFSTSITKALSGVLCVKKEMAKTFRPGVARIFKHLPSECQQNENRSYLDDDLPGCRDILVYRSATICPPMSREYAEVGQNVQCVQLCTAMPNHSGFAVTAHLELIILLTADLSRGPGSELKPFNEYSSNIYVQSDQ